MSQVVEGDQVKITWKEELNFFILGLISLYVLLNIFYLTKIVFELELGISTVVNIFEIAHCVLSLTACGFFIYK